MKAPVTHQGWLPGKWEKEAGGQEGMTEACVHIKYVKVGLW